MKNIVLVLGLVLCMAGFGNSAAAEDEVTSLRGKGRSKLEFKPGFWKTQKKQDEAKAAAYEKAIDLFSPRQLYGKMGRHHGPLRSLGQPEYQEACFHLYRECQGELYFDCAGSPDE